MAKSSFTIDVTGFPEALSAMRVALANLLRERANEQLDEHTAKVLREIAADFEVGLQ